MVNTKWPNQPTNQPTNQPNYIHPDELEISLVDIVRSIWAGRKLIACLTSACVTLALGVAFLTSQYKSESHYYFGGSFKYGENPDLGSYDRFISAAKTPERFDAWLQAMQLEALPEADALRGIFVSRKGVQGQITAILPELFKSKPNGSAPVLGFKIELAAKKPQDAHKALTLLSRYLADMLLYDNYQRRLEDKMNSVMTQHVAIENELFTLRTQRPHLEQQQVLIETLIGKYSEHFAAGQRADMLIRTEGALGSSPIVQLMNVQLELAKLDQKREELLRQQKQVGLIQAFYQQSQAAWQTQHSAERFAEQLPQILTVIFKNQNLIDEPIKEVFNDLTIETQALQNLWQENQRNLIAPSMTPVSTARFALAGAGA